MSKDITQVKLIHIPCKTDMVLESTLNDHDALFTCPVCKDQIITRVVDK